MKRKMYAVAISVENLHAPALYLVKGVTEAEALGVALAAFKGSVILDWTIKIVGDLYQDRIRARALVELQRGRKIGAIRAVREYTGWGLKEAKAFCDDLIAAEPSLLGPSDKD